MKKILTILLYVMCLGANAQTEREILLDISKQVNKLNEQMTTNNTKIDLLEKTTAITSAKMESLEKNVDKRLDGIDKRLDFMQTLLIIIIPLVLTSVVGIVGFVLWDRSTAIRPVEAETKKEIEKLKEREQKLEERLETALKKIAQIEPRFTGI